MLIAMNGVKYPPESLRTVCSVATRFSSFQAARTMLRTELHLESCTVTSFVPIPRTRKTGKPVGGRHEASLRPVRHNQVWSGSPEALLARILLQALQEKIPCASGAAARAPQELAPMAVRLRIDRDHNSRQFQGRAPAPERDGRSTSSPKQQTSEALFQTCSRSANSV
jgi:hypothetical protein